MILDAEENLGRQISSLLSAERTSARDRLKWKLSDARRYVAPAALTGD
jgi:hypothetical protein